MRITYTILLLLTLGSCSSFTDRPTTSLVQLPEEKLVLHTVQYRGESLSAISSWYLASSSRWPEISSYNGHIDLLNLQPGDIIRIPAALIKRPEPLPESYLRDLERRNKGKTNEKAGANVFELSPNEKLIGSFLE